MDAEIALLKNLLLTASHGENVSVRFNDTTTINISHVFGIRVSKKYYNRILFPSKLEDLDAEDLCEIVENLEKIVEMVNEVGLKKQKKNLKAKKDKEKCLKNLGKKLLKYHG